MLEQQSRSSRLMPSSAHLLAAQRSPTNALPDPDSVGGNGVVLRRVSCCNHAATEAERIRTEQESYGARIGKNRLDKLDFPTGQYLLGKR